MVKILLYKRITGRYNFEQREISLIKKIKKNKIYIQLWIKKFHTSG